MDEGIARVFPTLREHEPEEPDYDDVCRYLLEFPEADLAVARVMAVGKKKYPDDKWKRQTVKDHLGHIKAHIDKYCMGDASDTHLVNIATRAKMAVIASLRDGGENGG